MAPDSDVRATAAFFFPLFLFWIWAIAFAAWTLAAGARTTARSRHIISRPDHPS